MSVDTQKPVAVQTGLTGPDGVVRLEFAPPAPGPYKLVATAKKGEQDLGKGEDAVAVRAVGPELSDASVRPELMAQIAKYTDGKAYRLPLDGLPALPAPVRIEPVEDKGTLVILTPKRFSASNPEHVALATAAALERLSRAEDGRIAYRLPDEATAAGRHHAPVLGTMACRGLAISAGCTMALSSSAGGRT